MEIRQEILNYKNKEDFETFVKLTNDSAELRTCFDNENENIEISSKRWLKHLKTILKASFSKLRIKKGNLDPKLQLLFQEKETIKSIIGQLENKNKFEEIKHLQDSLENIDEKIANMCANRNKKFVDEFLGKTEDTIEGYNQTKTWGLTKKLSPKNSIEPPCAKKDKNGYLVTDKEALEKLYIETYTERLKPNKIREGFSEFKTMKEYLFNINHKIAEERPSNDWKLEDLEKSLKSFKNNKSRY